MTEYVFVKPSAGGRIRMPERNMMPMAAEGALVPRVDYYERLILTGDVLISDQPSELGASVDTTAPKVETEMAVSQAIETREPIGGASIDIDTEKRVDSNRDMPAAQPHKRGR